jgi:predicted RNA-binding Zn-ribbon protein involved in translation (DUF1610 family)
MTLISSQSLPRRPTEETGPCPQCGQATRRETKLGHDRYCPLCGWVEGEPAERPD